ncbi:uncharacterized protein LOC142830640 [Pelodiscus sinensis]|uniref:uncharacterized protein LOC142830640 n=1 Tax=Pelodiscus sinensis TaxID=13735 RepID=UPI003F6C5AA7
MSQPSEGSQPSTAPHDQPGGSREPARGRKRRAPAWSSAEIVDLIEVWGEASNVHDLRTSHRNAAVYGRMAASLAARGHQRSREQVRCKIKDLRQSYSRACLPGADPEACPHFHALDRILGPHAVPAPRDVIDPGAEGPLLETEEEEEGSESQEPAASLPRTRDPRGTPQSRSPASSEAGEASTSAAPGPAGRTTPPAAAARARASRTARNQEDYQRRHLRFLDRQLRLQDHWVQEDLRLRQRSLEEEEALLSRRRNADLYRRLAQNLAQQGPPGRNCEQVRSKVKELQLGHHNTVNMNPAQLYIAVVSIANTSRIILQYVQSIARNCQGKEESEEATYIDQLETIE